MLTSVTSVTGVTGVTGVTDVTGVTPCTKDGKDRQHNGQINTAIKQHSCPYCDDKKTSLKQHF